MVTSSVIIARQPVRPPQSLSFQRLPHSFHFSRQALNVTLFFNRFRTLLLSPQNRISLTRFPSTTSTLFKITDLPQPSSPQQLPNSLPKTQGVYPFAPFRPRSHSSLATSSRNTTTDHVLSDRITHCLTTHYSLSSALFRATPSPILLPFNIFRPLCTNAGGGALSLAHALLREPRTSAFHPSLSATVSYRPSVRFSRNTDHESRNTKQFLHSSLATSSTWNTFLSTALLTIRSSHSCRNTTIGSTRHARRAGTQHPSSATASSSNATPPNVNGSVAARRTAGAP